MAQTPGRALSSLSIFAAGVTCGWLLAFCNPWELADVSAFPLNDATPARSPARPATRDELPAAKRASAGNGSTAIEAASVKTPDFGLLASKSATESTRQTNAAVAERLPFADTQDFTDAARGLIAPLANEGIVKDDQGRIVWNLPEFVSAPVDEPPPETIHPALWRQCQLLGISGLFKVTDRIYQVRGLDLANITFIEGDTGLIVVDPLLSTETAQAALQLYLAHRPAKPVLTVIYTHSHADHFGGVAGVASPADIATGTVQVIAPENFIEEVVNENILAGNAMQRRAGYMYGGLLPKTVTGDVGNGLGLGTSTGTTLLIKPNVSIQNSGEKRVIDGLTFEFLLTPGSEAPAEMHFHIAELKALCPAENATHTMHNLYTLRGARVRDARAWASYLQQTIDRFGDRTEVMFAPHHWPIWDRERIVAHLTQQRDLYKFVHDQTLHHANLGYNMEECAEQIKLPPEIENHWANRGYYGSLNHNIKAVWNYYLGWFDGNPARLHPLPPREAGQHYVDFMGGMDSVVSKAQVSFDRGEYRWVAQVLDHAVSAMPDHVGARALLADALEQLGYQSESGPWRNFYLSGAQELREGVQIQPRSGGTTPHSIAALSLPVIFDSLAVRLNLQRTSEQPISINFRFKDTGEEYVVVQKNGVMNYFADRQDPRADCTVRLTRTLFDQILERRTGIVKQIARGQMRLTGQPRKLQQFFRPLQPFDPWFNVMSPAPPIEVFDDLQETGE